MTFNLFASRYATGDDPVLNVPWSARAYADLRAAAGARGYTALPGALDLLPAGGGRRCTGLRTADGPVDLAVMACWRGRGEVEAIVMYTHGSGRTQETALHDLARQVLTALRQT
jgi:hypothetical protein